MAQERKRNEARAPKSISPSSAEMFKKEEDGTFSDIEDDDGGSVHSDITVTPHNVSSNYAINTSNDSGLGSESSTPILEQKMADLQLENTYNAPELEVVEPLEGYERVLTIVLLHADGSSGAELRHLLLEATKCSTGKTLQQELPGLKWIFPTAPYVDHVKADKTVEKRRMWVDFGIHDEVAKRDRKMHGGLSFTMDTVRRILDSEGSRLGFKEKIRDGIPWERDEIVFGGQWHGTASALVSWICFKTEFAGFVGIRGVLPTQHLITQQFNEDVARGRPPRRGLDFGEGTNNLIVLLKRCLSPRILDFIEKIASTPVLLTLHEGDTHWLFDSKTLARSLYGTVTGSTNQLLTKCVGNNRISPQGADQGITVEELDAIRKYLRWLAQNKNGKSQVMAEGWIELQKEFS